MSATITLSSSSSCTPETDAHEEYIPQYEHFGPYEDGFRSKYGEERWNRKFNQKYSGYFLYNNLHGDGFYIIRQHELSNFYCGSFYNNKIEGYGQVVFSDKKVFEGLFKGNRRYGPGVLSYDNNTQDVGLWDGNYLMRLSVAVHQECVPSLTSTNLGKIRLFKYRTIVSIEPEKEDQCYNILESLTKNERALDRYQEMYNLHVRNPYSKFFNRRLYDEDFFGPEDQCIDVIVDDEEHEQSVALEEVPCTGEEQMEESEECSRIAIQIGQLQSLLEECRLEKRNLIKDIENCFMCCHPFGTIGQLSHDRIKTLLARLNKYEMEKSDFISSMDLETSFRSNEVKLKESMDYGEDAHYCFCTHDNLSELEFLEQKLNRLEEDEFFFESVISFLNGRFAKRYNELKPCRPTPRPTEKIQVTHLMAWNNELWAIDMLKQSFRHRNFESSVSFSVRALLTGLRDSFKEPGPIEEASLRFLKYCRDGNYKEAQQLLWKHEVNPDVCDARGNAGVIYATCRDKIDIIRILANSGAKLDVVNDQCLTALNLCLLRYLALVYRVADWERSFLPETAVDDKDKKEVTNWRPRQSFLSLSGYKLISDSDINILDTESSDNLLKTCNINLSFITDGAAIVDDTKSRISSKISSSTGGYLFKILTPSKHPGASSMSSESEPKKSGKKKSGGNTPKTQSVVTPKTQSVCMESTSSVVDHLQNIFLTMQALITYGADPNIGGVPIQMLYLSFFTDNADIVGLMLRGGFNVNHRNEEGLTPLLVLVSMKPTLERARMLERLLAVKDTDINARTPNSHWKEIAGSVVGDYPMENKLEPKNALHVISVREDHENDEDEAAGLVAKMLIERGVLLCDYYLGHSALTLAILKGNIPLIRMLSSYLDINEALPNQMGNAMAIHGLKRYPNALSPYEASLVINLLSELGLSPLDPVYEFDTLMDFLDYEHDIDSSKPKQVTFQFKKDAHLRQTMQKIIANAEKPSVDKTDKKDKKDKKEGDKAKAKKGPPGMPTNQLMRVYIGDDARKYVIFFNQLKATKYLYQFMKLDYFQHEMGQNLAKFLTREIALRCLELLYQSNKIAIPFNKELTFKMLDWIKCFEGKKRRNSKTPSSKITTASFTSPPGGLKRSFEDLLDIMEMHPVPKIIFNTPYERDTITNDPLIYDVCFFCLKKKDKHLVVCPKCGLVKFCSTECNKQNNKQFKFPHRCGGVFYDTERKRIEELLKLGVIVVYDPLATVLNHATLERRKQEREMKAIARLRKFGFSNEDIEKRMMKARSEAEGTMGTLPTITDYSQAGTATVSGSQAIPSDKQGTSGGEGVEAAGASATRLKGKPSKEGVVKPSKSASKSVLLDSSSMGPSGLTGLSTNLDFGPGVPGDVGGPLTASFYRGNVGAGKKGGGGGGGGGGGMGKIGGKRAARLDADTVKVGQRVGKFSTSFGRSLKHTDGMTGGTSAGLSVFEWQDPKQRLWRQYLYFLEQINKLFPDFDLGCCIMPYVCYVNGELFYKFIDTGKYFCQTYSRI